jgi:putative zinc finger/helix-turn-helix YgiT family protein
MACDQCGTETTSASQHSENLRRLKARKEHYGALLMGEEIAALRKRYGLTQQAASRIFGKGKIAFSRYENEVTYPDDSTTRLLAMAIAKPDALKWLADQAGEELPLWAERCEDRRLAIHSIPGPVSLLPLLKRSQLQARIEDPSISDDGWHPLKLTGQQPSIQTVKQRLPVGELKVAA